MQVKNNGNQKHLVRTASGELAELRPGATMNTWDLSVLSLDGVAEVVPGAGPYFNDAVAQSLPASAGAGDDQTIVLNSTTEAVEIINDSESVRVTVFRQAATNVPGLILPPGTTREIEDLHPVTTQLVLQFSGAVDAGDVVVTEFKE